MNVSCSKKKRKEKERKKENELFKSRTLLSITCGSYKNILTMSSSKLGRATRLKLDELGQQMGYTVFGPLPQTYYLIEKKY